MKLCVKFSLLAVTGAICFGAFFITNTGHCAVKSVSAENLLRTLKTKTDLILVDVRNPGETNKFRIPGSINIPLFALKTKDFLRTKSLILIHEGHVYRELASECEVLSKSGFKVAILDGGLYQWRLKGGPVEGDVFLQKELSRLSQQEFRAGKGHENWLVIDVAESTASYGRQKPDNLNVRRIHIPFEKNQRDFPQKVKSAINSTKAKQFLSVVISDEKGTSYDAIEKRLMAAGIHNTLYLDGGFEGYKAFEKQAYKMEAKGGNMKEKTSQTLRKGCSTCR